MRELERSQFSGSFGGVDQSVSWGHNKRATHEKDDNTYSDSMQKSFGRSEFSADKIMASINKEKKVSISRKPNNVSKAISLRKALGDRVIDADQFPNIDSSKIKKKDLSKFERMRHR